MLHVPILDDLGYETLFARARGQIPTHTAEWTDFNEHDPGITVLQTFAWLADTLNYYIDATGEAHRCQYLNLLGLRPRQAAARCNIAITGQGEISLGRGARLAAGDTVFELAHSCREPANSVIALFCETGETMVDLTPFAGVDGELATVFTMDRQAPSALYIGFSGACGGRVRFYADARPHPRRNPFDDGFTLSRLRWEYYDGAGWQAAELLEDETCGLLRGGFIGLELGGGTGPLAHPTLPAGHYLRAVLEENAYDALPRLGHIYPNCVPAVQTDTISQALEYTWDGSGELALDCHVRQRDVIRVAVGDGEAYTLWFDEAAGCAPLCEVALGASPWQRVIRFDRERFGAEPRPGQQILVTVTDSAFLEKQQLGITKGYACEQLEVDLEELCELRLALAEERAGRAVWQLWSPCDNLAGAAWDARVFRYDKAGGRVIFGDGLAGLQPPAGRRVLAVTVKASRLGEGNVRAGQVDRLLDEAPGILRVHNPAPASGGRRPQTAEELEREIGEKLAGRTRAVTEQDYRDIVLGTPGLMLDAAAVISSREYCRFYGGTPRPNLVLLAVKPYSEHEPRPPLSEMYSRRIRENLEPYRLLTTDVRILPARYAGIEVAGRMKLTDDSPANRARVEETLREQVESTGTKRFGAGIVYGRVFSRLELLDCVVRVEQLAFSCMGDAAVKSGQGDIDLHPDALAYLSGIHIEYV